MDRPATHISGGYGHRYRKPDCISGQENKYEVFVRLAGTLGRRDDLCFLYGTDAGSVP